MFLFLFLLFFSLFFFWGGGGGGGGGVIGGLIASGPAAFHAGPRKAEKHFLKNPTHFNMTVLLNLRLFWES